MDPDHYRPFHAIADRWREEIEEQAILRRQERGVRVLELARLVRLLRGARPVDEGGLDPRPRSRRNRRLEPIDTGSRGSVAQASENLHSARPIALDLSIHGRDNRSRSVIVNCRPRHGCRRAREGPGRERRDCGRPDPENEISPIDHRHRGRLALSIPMALKTDPAAAFGQYAKLRVKPSCRGAPTSP